MLKGALETGKKHPGLHHADTLAAAINLSSVYLDANEAESAVKLLESYVPTAKSSLGQSHLLTICLHNLAGSYEKTGQIGKAISAAEETLRITTAERGPGDPFSLKAMRYLASYYLKAKNYNKAEPILRECLAIQSQEMPKAWSTFDVQCMFGQALLGLKKYKQAEDQLLSGYRGLENAVDSSPKKGQRKDTIECLIQLYTDTNDLEEVARWKAELEQAKPQSTNRH